MNNIPPPLPPPIVTDVFPLKEEGITITKQLIVTAEKSILIKSLGSFRVGTQSLYYRTTNYWKVLLYFGWLFGSIYIEYLGCKYGNSWGIIGGITFFGCSIVGLCQGCGDHHSINYYHLLVTYPGASTTTQTITSINGGMVSYHGIGVGQLGANSYGVSNSEESIFQTYDWGCICRIETSIHNAIHQSQ